MRSLDVWGEEGLHPRWTIPYLEWELDPKMGAANPWCECAALFPGTSWEGAVQLLSFSPLSPSMLSTPIMQHILLALVWGRWVQDLSQYLGRRRTLLKSWSNLKLLCCVVVICDTWTKIWNLGELNFGLILISLWLWSLHLPLLPNTLSPLVAQKPGTSDSLGSGN